MPHVSHISAIVCIMGAMYAAMWAVLCDISASMLLAIVVDDMCGIMCVRLLCGSYLLLSACYLLVLRAVLEDIC